MGWRRSFGRIRLLPRDQRWRRRVDSRERRQESLDESGLYLPHVQALEHLGHRGASLDEGPHPAPWPRQLYRLLESFDGLCGKSSLFQGQGQKYRDFDRLAPEPPGLTSFADGLEQLVCPGQALLGPRRDQDPRMGDRRDLEPGEQVWQSGILAEGACQLDSGPHIALQDG